jgi:hypothetical protein
VNDFPGGAVNTHDNPIDILNEYCLISPVDQWLGHGPVHTQRKQTDSVAVTLTPP